MKKVSSSFISSDSNTLISVTNWIPDNNPIGVLQISHGMLEYIDRYDEFAGYMAERGFVVVGHDHLGHGESVKDKTDWGFFHEEKGNELLVSDIKRLMDITRAEYGHLPYFLMGHSMGSFLVRQFMFTYLDENLTGCIVMGTGQKSKSLIALGKMLAKFEGKIKGWKESNKIVKKIFIRENIKKIKILKL